MEAGFEGIVCGQLTIRMKVFDTVAVKSVKVAADGTLSPVG